MEAKTIAAIRRSLAEAGIPEMRLAERAAISRAYLSDILAGNRSGERKQEQIEAAARELVANPPARRVARRRGLQDELHQLALEIQAKRQAEAATGTETEVKPTPQPGIRRF